MVGRPVGGCCSFIPQRPRLLFVISARQQLAALSSSIPSSLVLKLPISSYLLLTPFVSLHLFACMFARDLQRATSTTCTTPTTCTSTRASPCCRCSHSWSCRCRGTSPGPCPRRVQLSLATTAAATTTAAAAAATTAAAAATAAAAESSRLFNMYICILNVYVLLMYTLNSFSIVSFTVLDDTCVYTRTTGGPSLAPDAVRRQHATAQSRGMPSMN